MHWQFVFRSDEQSNVCIFVETSSKREHSKKGGGPSSQKMITIHFEALDLKTEGQVQGFEENVLFQYAVFRRIWG